MKRQRQEQPFIRTIDSGFQQSLEIGQEITMAQGHPFGPVADTGGIKQDSLIIGSHRRDRLQRLSTKVPPALRISVVGIQQNDGAVLVEAE